MTAYAAGTPAVQYTATARTLHWLTAALVLPMVPIGLLIANVELGRAAFLYDLHRSIGVLLLLLLLLRLWYRVTHPPPPLPSDLPQIQRLAAHATHWSLYLLLILQCLVGWIATSAYPARVNLFWLIELPLIWWEDRALSERLFVVHLWLGLMIAALICAHVGAALFHHFVRRDDILLRMVGR
jgi:cytochrome b561